MTLGFTTAQVFTAESVIPWRCSWFVRDGRLPGYQLVIVHPLQSFLFALHSLFILILFLMDTQFYRPLASFTFHLYSAFRIFPLSSQYLFPVVSSPPWPIVLFVLVCWCVQRAFFSRSIILYLVPFATIIPSFPSPSPVSITTSWERHEDSGVQLVVYIVASFHLCETMDRVMVQLSYCSLSYACMLCNCFSNSKCYVFFF